MFIAQVLIEKCIIFGSAQTTDQQLQNINQT